VRFNVFDETVLILAHPKEIVGLAEPFDRTLTVGAETVDDVLFGPEPFIECAVPSSIGIFIN
jgi:hypothetical protein